MININVSSLKIQLLGTNNEILFLTLVTTSRPFSYKRTHAVFPLNGKRPLNTVQTVCLFSVQGLVGVGNLVPSVICLFWYRAVSTSACQKGEKSAGNEVGEWAVLRLCMQHISWIKIRFFRYSLLWGLKKGKIWVDKLSRTRLLENFCEIIFGVRRFWNIFAR